MHYLTGIAKQQQQRALTASASIGMQSYRVLPCAGKLRKTILAFYAQTSDHVKRLTSPLANGKFSSISAGPDTPWGRPEALRAVVTDLKVCAG